jgi:hypothetical protein
MNAITSLGPVHSSILPKERPVWMERQWVAIDGLGTVRNSLFTTSVFLGSAAKASGVILKMIPGFQVFGGGLIAYSAARYTIPNAWKEFKAVDPQDKEGKLVAGLSVANQVCYGAFGPAFLVAGATGIASIATSGAVSSALGTAAEIAGSGVLGGICVARGLVMMARSAINLNRLIPFHKEFHEAILSDKVDAFLREKMKDLAAMKRVMGEDAAEKVEDYLKGSNSISREELIQLIDKGIFKQKCKQWLTLSLAFLMIVGGIASIIFSAGITAIVIGAIMGISFTLMEAQWLVFDKSDWFNALVDKCYTQPKAIASSSAEPLSA